MRQHRLSHLVRSAVLALLIIVPAGSHVVRAQTQDCASLKNPVLETECWLKKLTAGERRLSGAKLAGVNLSGISLVGVDLSGADLSYADLSEVKLEGVDLTGANLKGARIQLATLTRVNLGGANLNRASVVRTSLVDTDLRNSTFHGALLHDLAFDGNCDFRNARVNRDTVFGNATGRDAWLRAGGTLD